MRMLNISWKINYLFLPTLQVPAQSCKLTAWTANTQHCNISVEWKSGKLHATMSIRKSTRRIQIWVAKNHDRGLWPRNSIPSPSPSAWEILLSCPALPSVFVNGIEDLRGCTRSETCWMVIFNVFKENLSGDHNKMMKFSIKGCVQKKLHRFWQQLFFACCNLGLTILSAFYDP